MQFDPRNASLAVHGSVAYSARNRADALEEARAAAEDAAARDLPFQYVVIRIGVEATFRPDGP